MPGGAAVRQPGQLVEIRQFVDAPLILALGEIGIGAGQAQRVARVGAQHATARQYRHGVAIAVHHPELDGKAAFAACQQALQEPAHRVQAFRVDELPPGVVAGRLRGGVAERPTSSE